MRAAIPLFDRQTTPGFQRSEEILECCFPGRDLAEPYAENRTFVRPALRACRSASCSIASCISIAVTSPPEPHPASSTVMPGQI
ncbi:hypothetical protein ABH15_00140 [Methanoculleus taiwanensis]|uniref:Uncharacterized protein n=1 Tax=Methanoculleus taiwanensis TaxID=1550565 RepID=A0A498H2E7_9EURY|nr:hypothetical protein ABH15_00140 [Methanoculleus taiwanensis]